MIGCSVFSSPIILAPGEDFMILMMLSRMVPFMGVYRVQALGFKSLSHPNMDGVLRIEPTLPAAKGYSSSVWDSCKDLFSPFLLQLSPATGLMSTVMST